MFENRSFDNLLGGLYGSAGAPQAGFNGIFTDGSPGTRSNPTPDGSGSVYSALTTDPFAPSVDPGECYADMNVQLFGGFIPASNKGLAGCPGKDAMVAPYNLPDPAIATMEGYVTDYDNHWPVVTGKPATTADYGQVMDYFDDQTLPVTYQLARSFGVFDNWFCDVPSDTFTNRSFFHAADSTGLVTEPPLLPWPTLNTAKTVLNEMTDAGISWNVFYDEWQVVPLTLLINFRSLWRNTDSFRKMDSFFDAVSGGTLPQYSFVEPRMLTVDPAGAPTNDMHPEYFKEFGKYVPEDVRQGDALLGRIYEAIRTSPKRDKTLLLVVFDENGGMHDHVAPPAATPPGSAPGQQDFGFDRLGVRIPAIAISSFVPEGTIVSDQMQNTSVIATLSKKWSLPALNPRSASAPTFEGVLSAGAPRDWPEVAVPDPPSPGGGADSLATPLGRAILGTAAIAAATRLKLESGQESGLTDDLAEPEVPEELAVSDLSDQLSESASGLGLQ